MRGSSLSEALTRETPLQIVGTINAYTALQAERAGFQALYLSGSGVASASFGLPDLGLTGLSDVLEDARRITSSSSLPLLIDADTGWGSALNIRRTVRESEHAGVAGLHLEDQIAEKRCGHRPGKQLVSSLEMSDRLKAALDARTNSQFTIMARTDAYSVEGFQSALERAARYVESGADMIFAEAMTTLDEYKIFAKAIRVPVLINMTEFGITPLFSIDELRGTGISIILYPLSAFRAMNEAARQVYETIRSEGDQRTALPLMQTREALYEVLGYHKLEEYLDARFRASKP